jgi:hypothetical protein
MVIKSRRIRWAGQVARMGVLKNVYGILVRKSESRRIFGRLKHRWDDNIKMHFKERSCEFVDWIIHLTQSRIQQLALVNTIMKLRIALDLYICHFYFAGLSQNLTSQKEMILCVVIYIKYGLL